MATQGKAVDAVDAVDLADLGFELDLISLERLEDQYPALASKIANKVEAGFTPAEIRRYVLAHSGSRGWAAWIEQAARAVADD